MFILNSCLGAHGIYYQPPNDIRDVLMYQAKWKVKKMFDCLTD